MDEKEWIDRILAGEKKSNSLLKEIEKQYNLSEEEVLAIVSFLWVKMGESVDLNRALQENYASTRQKIRKVVDKLYKEELLPATQVYRSGIYAEGFETAMKALPLNYRGSGLPFKNAEWVQKQLDTKWAGDGKSFNDRIGLHKEQLKKALDVTLRDHIMQGTDTKKISKAISEKFEIEYHKVERLIRTETNYVMNKSELDCLMNSNVEWYRYSAHLDRRTSSICRGLNGKPFKVEDAIVGVNYPPNHVNCRSTVVPILDDEPKGEE